MKRTLILISDGLPAANGGGISQTLYNLLDAWQGRIYFVSRPGEKPVSGPVLDVSLVPYAFEQYGSFGNRLLKKLNGRILKANFNRQHQLKKVPKGLPTAAEAFVLVSTTEPIKLQLAWLLQERFGYTVIPYFMDDWMGGLELQWKGSSIYKVVASLLSQAPCWLMISRQLEETLVKRYGLIKKPTLVIHNPAPGVGIGKVDKVNKVNKVDKLTISEQDVNKLEVGVNTVDKGPGSNQQGNEIDSHKSEISNQRSDIVYAGSIWPMHFDALQAVAKAVQLLNQQHKAKYRLLIYTGAAAWQHNRKALEGPGIEYGGFIPYIDMPAKLAESWLLLVTASFLPRYAPFTNSSVQTKLTDYMASGKPVLFVGPSESASGQFVHDWDCGFSIGATNPVDIAAQLEAITALPQLSERKANNGLVAVAGYFNKKAVQERLYGFLEEYGCASALQKADSYV